MSDATNIAYWQDYDGLQKTKHAVLGKYVDGWFPILSTIADGLLLYVDCHAGRGRHATGDAGSPVLVLNKLLQHRHLDQILSRCRVHLHLFEVDADNADALEQEMRTFNDLPSKIRWEIHREDYAGVLSEALDNLEKGAAGVPALAFVDPFGFTLSMSLLNRLLRAGQTELLITFMLRFIDMAIAKGDKDDILNDLFGSDAWKRVRGIADYNERVEAIISTFAAGLDGYVRWVIMRSEGGEVKYVLFYATRHVRGLQVFKDSVYAVIPDGSFTAFERDRPEQTLLFGTNIEPPLQLIREFLGARFAGKTVWLYDEIYEAIDLSTFRRTHAHQVIKEDVVAGLIENLNEPGKFVISHNPMLRFGQASGAARHHGPSLRDARAARP